MKDAFTIAVRDYYDPTLRSMCRDRVVRSSRNKFYLVEEPSSEGGREVFRPLDLADIFDWYRFEPWQISRTVLTAADLALSEGG